MELSLSSLIKFFLLPLKEGVYNKLALINTPVSDDDLVINALNDLGYEFKEIAAAVRAREPHISFEELLKKLTDYEEALKHQESVSKIVVLSAHFDAKSASVSADRFKPSRAVLRVVNIVTRWSFCIELL